MSRIKKLETELKQSYVQKEIEIMTNAETNKNHPKHVGSMPRNNRMKNERSKNEIKRIVVGEMKKLQRVRAARQKENDTKEGIYRVSHKS